MPHKRDALYLRLKSVRFIRFASGRSCKQLTSALASEKLPSLWNAPSAVTIELVSNIHTGDAAGDAIVSIESFAGSSYNEIFTGDGGANIFSGGAGADVFRGNNGVDILTGGTGADTFVYATAESSSVDGGIEMIVDFSHTDGDKIDLSTVTDFTFIGTPAFSGVVGELRYETIDGDTFVYGDRDGDALADLSITIAGSMDLLTSDFIL